LREDDSEFQITLVSKQNFFVFTPMLPQVVSGTIETNHVVVPLRQTLRKTECIEADVSEIDVKQKRITVRLEGGRSGSSRLRSQLTPSGDSAILNINYDHLVVSLGSETNFFDKPHLEDSVFTIRNLKDALVLRNHIIDMLERADSEGTDEKRKQMLTFVIVGGGLSGIETATELNDFLLEAIRYYPNIAKGFSKAPVSIIIVQSRDRVLPELNSRLAVFTQEKLRKDGIEVILNAKVVDAAKGFVKLLAKDGTQSSFSANTIIWTTGISPNPIIAEIPGEKPPSGRLQVDRYLHVNGYDDIWATGDCAYIINEITGEPYPPTAQHAIRESEIIAENIVKSIKGEANKLRKFSYAKNAQMAIIGKRTAIASIGGFDFHGFLIWCLWRAIYLRKLPMLKKRLRVAVDWTIDIFFDRDLTHIRGLKDERLLEKIDSG